MQSRAKIIVKGLVQGVGFRFFTVQEAQDLNLLGTVKNLPNGAVEVIAEGEKSMVHTLIKNLRVGPRHSRVTSVDVEWQEPQNDFTTFRVIS